jgi:hypothetical protein
LFFGGDWAEDSEIKLNVCVLNWGALVEEKDEQVGTDQKKESYPCTVDCFFFTFFSLYFLLKILFIQGVTLI